MKATKHVAFATIVSLAALVLSGCSTGMGTSMIAGTGVGALIGQAAGGDTGSPLVVNKPGYLVNARFHIDGNRLVGDDPGFSAVLERVSG